MNQCAAAVLATLLAAGCASARDRGLKSSAGGARAAAPASGDAETSALQRPLVAVEDPALGVKLELPEIDGGWQVPREGRAARRGANVQLEVGGFALSREASASSCRDTARERFTKERPDRSAAEPLREQSIGDWPTSTWSFTRGSEEALVRSRWAFYARGADCLLLQVSAPKDDQFAAVVFDIAARTFKARPLEPDRQREVDLLAGMSFLERREPASALERFESLARREPSFSKAHFGALMAAFELGPPAYARGLPHGLLALKAERDLSPEQRQLALRAVGVMQLAENEVRGATQTLAELVVRAPDLAEGQYNYACALARIGDKGGALDHLGAAMRLDRELAKHAKDDDDLKILRGDAHFEQLLNSPPPKADAAPREKMPPGEVGGTDSADEPGQGE